MSAFMDDLARATLPVAIALVLLAGAARAALWAGIDEAPVARRYLDPLVIWCVATVAVHAVARGAAGGAGVLSLALPFGIAAIAVLLRAEAAAPEQPPEPEPAPPADSPARPGSLWLRPADDDAGRRSGNSQARPG